MPYFTGKWKAICDVCGFEFYNDELKKRWDGLMVCTSDYEQDHPQKFLRLKEDSSSVPWVRAEPEDIEVLVCYLYARSAYADLAEADCAEADNNSYSYDWLYKLKAGTG